MYLSSVEIQGFKSFAHKTRLEFDHALTAIVGPNGSGKSNISDAVRWVLGEQSARQLRGSEMLDVIFSGTELRKPQGLARVSITIDNSDHLLNSPYNEISITRRLFRSGESEYLINGSIVRLKDVQELFFDTGIGRDGYSIIGQGRVEMLLSGKPDERRGIFDEAAGIVKYKVRKNESLRKLASEQENLKKVREILSELEERLSPLKKQSDDARTYLSLRDEKRLLDINLFLMESESLSAELSQAKNDKLIVEESLRELSAEKDSLSFENLDTAKRISRFNDEINAKKEEISRALLLKQNLLGQISVREAEFSASEESLKALKDDFSRLESERSDNASAAREYLSSLDTLERELKDLGEDDLASGGENREEIENIAKRIDGFRKNLSFCLPEESLSPGEGEAKEDEPLDDCYEMPPWLKAITLKRSKLSELKEREEKNLLWLRTAQEEYNALTLLLKEKRQDLSKRQKHYLDQKARHDSLNEFSQKYEGFGESVKAVMAMRGTLGGIHGTAADIISTDRSYETAIEAALGGRIQNIICDNEDDASRIIDYLKKTKKGRVTLLPLDKVGAGSSKELLSASREEGSLGIASDLVEYEEIYRGAVSYLLGGVMVARDLKSALSIADRYHHRLRIVTLEGELISPGGAITGGAYKNNLNLIGRKSRLKELGDLVLSAKRSMDSLQDEINVTEKDISLKTSELESINETLRGIDHEKQELSLSIVSDARIKTGEFSQKASFIEENILRLSKQYQGFDERKNELDLRRKDILSKKEQSLADIEERKLDISGIEEGISAGEARIKTLEEERDAIGSYEKERFERVQEINNSLLDLNKELIRFESIIERKNQKIDDEALFILDEYGINADRARDCRDESLSDKKAIRTRLTEIKEVLRSLGPINIDAINEYRDKSDRYSFLKEQETDLIESEKTVREAISELESTMREIFSEKFATINAEFGRVFSELFDGGSAFVSLITEGGLDELSAGIAISAQPPGKKLKNIMQLSGGERALTAIALLFAIQSLKPSPFCLLDEIEASLDDVNVSRFTSYLRRLEGRTQFICITHKRGTMEAASRLYGITMQERGVSKLVSVKLIENELT